MLGGEDDETRCEGTLLSGQEVDNLHHSVDHLPKSKEDLNTQPSGQLMAPQLDRSIL